MFPAPCPFQFGIDKCRHDIIDQSPIRPSAPSAGPGPQSSVALSSHQPAQNHPPPAPLPDQFPIDGQLLAAVPRVRFSEAFGTPALGPRPGRLMTRPPASETLTDTSPPDTLQTTNRLRLLDSSISTQRHPATGQPCREALEISEFFGSLLSSDTQAGPTRRCPPDGYDVSCIRVSQMQRWRRWEGSTARSQR